MIVYNHHYFRALWTFCSNVFLIPWNNWELFSHFKAVKILMSFLALYLEVSCSFSTCKSKLQAVVPLYENFCRFKFLNREIGQRKKTWYVLCIVAATSKNDYNNLILYPNKKALLLKVVLMRTLYMVFTETINSHNNRTGWEIYVT